MQIQLIFTRKVLYLASFWKWEFLELENGSFAGYVSENLVELYHLGHVCMEVGHPR